MFECTKEFFERHTIVKDNGQCNLNCCSNKVNTRGYCLRHFYKAIECGFLVKKTRTGLHVLDYIKSRCVTNKETGCIEYQGALDGDGYGQLNYAGYTNGTSLRVHRIVWVEHNGPTDLYILHKCDNPKCCNIEHLFAGTQADNVADMINKGRGNTGVGFKLTVNDVLAIRSSTESNAALAKKLNVQRATVMKARSKRTWKEL